MNRKKQVFKYIFFDVVSAAIAWTLFNYYRKRFIETPLFAENIYFTPDSKFFLGLVLFCMFWVLLFDVTGFYNDVFRKSRLKELGNSISITLIGVIFIFFLLLLDDYISTYRNYYQLFTTLFILIFLLTYIPRLIITSDTIHKIHKRIYGFKTVIIGDGEKALELYNELQSQKKSQGYKIIGYVPINQNSSGRLQGIIPELGGIAEISQIVRNYQVEELLIAPDKSDGGNMVKIINDLLGLNVVVKAIPSLYDYLTGRVKMSGILGAPLMLISFELMPVWQVRLKQLIDYIFALIAIIISIPIALILIILIKSTSRGPLLHKQERIGQYGKPFTLFKFRSMFIDAEAAGPALSSKNDMRVTPIGRFMRKTRLDEIPNFFNVLRGEMSLVGPRPERQYYIDQIVQVAPHYIHLQKVKPGITSWGQVKYGYAENIDQMVERLKYDLLYIENMSIFVDIKIIIYTLITIFKGKGV